MSGKGLVMRAVASLATIGMLVSACLFISCGKKEEGATKQSTADTILLAEARKNLEKLVGRWQRPDGGAEQIPGPDPVLLSPSSGYVILFHLQ